jgi:tripartite ATP-independent transporter DctM subunit
MDMEWFEIGAMMIGLVVGLMALGIPVAFAFLLSNIVGAFLFMGGISGVEQLINNATRSVSSFLLVPIPLFILMGEIFFHTGLSQQIFSTLDKLFGRVQGRLSYMAVVGGTIFAALSGSSISTTAMLGTSMVPEMMSRGYKKHMAMGPILGSGSLAILIPPSALVVLLGSLAFIDIGALLIGGILPGLCLAILYTITIYILIKIDPSSAPQYDVDQVTFLEKIKLTTIYILPLGLVFFLVVGFIVLGIATPSESAAFGVLGVFILATLFKCMSWLAIRKALEGTLVVTVMVLMILLASSTFSQIMAFSGASSELVEWATGFELSPIVMLLAMFSVLLVLGMFVDQISQMMLTIPLFLPLAKSLGFDPVWFGIVIILALEISTVTPPFGLLLFVMMGVAPPNTTFSEVVVSGLPYILCAFVMLGLLVAFPEIVLFLPSL